MNLFKSTGGAKGVKSFLLSPFVSMDTSNIKEIVHDLKTPITSIMGFVELLKQGNYDKKSTSEFYDIILTESQKLLEMVNDILCVSKNEIPAPKSTSCNLNIQINQHVKELTPLAHSRNIEININNPVGDVYVSVPAEKISRILVNIIENAIKYNREHGKVSVDLHQEDDMVFIKIRDTGIGIPENELSKVFNKNYRSSISKELNIEGSGLGLAIAGDIIREYKGQIRVTSELNKYTEFIICFPVSNVKKS